MALSLYHNTLNRFRSERLKGEIEAIFTQIVLLLEKKGLVSLETNFLDGTKIETNANRYTFVWAGAIIRHKGKISEQLEELWSYTEKVSQNIGKINQVLKDKKTPSKIRKKLNYTNKNGSNEKGSYTKRTAQTRLQSAT